MERQDIQSDADITRLLREVIRSAYNKLTPEEKQPVNRAIQRLTKGISEFGQMSAVETLAQALWVADLAKPIPKTVADLKRVTPVD